MEMTGSTSLPKQGLPWTSRSAKTTGPCDVTVTRIAPVTEQLILSFIVEKVLDLPKSY